MNRRSFLLAGAATLAAGHASAEMKMMEGMPGPGGMQHGQHNMKSIPAKSPALPEGAPLRTFPRLANGATEPGVFEATVTAEPSTAQFVKGVDTPILAYNGITPGPMIEAMEGDRIRITFVNHIPNEESTIHWHGMPVPADQDGNPMDPVASGTDRTYTFDLPMGSAGSYWYHPHPHGSTAEQVYRGLAGAFLVKPKVDPIPAA